jgi:ribosome assembly protein RRB1
MKWSNLQKTNKDGFEDEDEMEEELEKFQVNQENSDDDDEDNDGEPNLDFRMIKHNGGINRIRCMPQVSTIVASWSDNSKVYINNIHDELESVEGRGVARGSQEIHAFSGHSTEGYGIAWNPHQVGQLVTGDCDGNTYLWQPDQGGTWNQSRILSSTSSFSSIEDIEFRKVGDNCANIFAICGGQQGKVGIVDVRNPIKCSNEFVAHNGDTNVLSWNPIVGQLLLTGGDDGTFKVWDVRSTGRGALANFKWQKDAVTSVDWHPTDEAVLAVSSADDTISIWDMSVEEDTSVPQESLQGTEYFPPQLLFLHMGQKSIKEIKFHKQIPGVIISTALDGFNIFKTFNI